MRNLIAIAVLLFGCQTYDGLYIDDSCSDREIELIETAVDKLNTAVGEEVVYINGVVNGGEDDTIGIGDASRDMIFCYPSDYEIGYGWNGKVNMDDIHIKSHDDNAHWLSTMMHELGHLIFGAWHITDPDAVMNRWNTSITEYNEADLIEFGY